MSNSNQVTNMELSFRLRHRITCLMMQILDILDTLNTNTGVSDPLFVEENSLMKFLQVPGRWPAYCRGWSDFHAYDSWPVVGLPVRARFQPLVNPFGPVGNEVTDTLLPPSSVFVTHVSAEDQERALRRTGFMAQQVLICLNHVTGNDQSQSLYDYLLIPNPVLAFFYIRGWKDRQDSFAQDTGVMALSAPGPELVVPPGTYLGPKQHMITPMSDSLPTVLSSRRMYVAHCLHSMPGYKVIIELGMLDEIEFDRHVDIAYVLVEEYYSQALYVYLHGSSNDHAILNNNVVQHALPYAMEHEDAEDREDARVREDGEDSGEINVETLLEDVEMLSDFEVYMDVENREDPVGQEDPVIREDPSEGVENSVKSKIQRNTSI